MSLVCRGDKLHRLHFTNRGEANTPHGRTDDGVMYGRVMALCVKRPAGGRLRCFLLNVDLSIFVAQSVAWLSLALESHYIHMRDA